MTSQPYRWAQIIAKSARVLVCMTTLTHRRFVDDAIQIVGLPQGARLQLRYRRNYVDEKVVALASLRGRMPLIHVILVLARSDMSPQHFEPLRVGEVLRLTLEGDLVLMEVKLGGFSAGMLAVWQDIASMAPALHQAERGSSSDSIKNFVQLLDRAPESVLVDETVEGWELATTAFFRADQNNTVPFLYYLNGVSYAFHRMKDTGDLVIPPGREIAWFLHTKLSSRPSRILNPVGEVLFDVSCEPLKMVTSRRIRVDSRRDAKLMKLSCDALFRPSKGHISIRVVQFDGHDRPNAESIELVPADDRRPITLSRFDVPTRTGRSMSLIACVAAGLAAAAAIVDLGPEWQLAKALGAGLLVSTSLFLGFQGRSN